MQKLCEDGNFQASYIKIRSKSILDYDFCFFFLFLFVVMVIKFGPLLPIIHPVYMHKWWWCARLFRCTMRCAQFSLKGIQNENKKMRLNERAHIYAHESHIVCFVLKAKMNCIHCWFIRMQYARSMHRWP